MDTEHPFGPYEPETVHQQIFMRWVHGLSDLIALSVERRECSLEMMAELRKMATTEVFAAYAQDLKELGIETIEAFETQLLLPMEEPFLRQNDGLIASDDETKPGLGPAGALERFEEMIFSQRGHVPDEELQTMFDALKSDGALLAASQKHRDHLRNIALRLKRHGLDLSKRSVEELAEIFFDSALQAALSDTGPTRLKKRGPTAGEPKRLVDAFGFNLAREVLRKLERQVRLTRPEEVEDQGHTAESAELRGPDAQKLLEIAAESCTALELECIKMKYLENLSYQAIADRRGVLKSTVQRCICNAKRKIRQAST